jgi:diadenylate cyclase
MPEELLASAVELVHQLRWVDVLDVMVVSALFYGAISWLRRAQSRFVVRGLAGAVALYFVARLLGMHLTLFIFQAALTVAVVALVVIFQEDIRRAFERIAIRARLGTSRSAPPWEQTVRLVSRVATQLAASRTGALIVFTGREPLDRHLAGGVPLQGQLSEPLLHSIFDPSSPGHDGALVVHLGSADRFGVHLPLSTQPDAENRGTRHAAALGLAERSDALVVVVSEERGTISVAHTGSIDVVKPRELRERLTAFIKAQAAERRVGQGGWLRRTALKLLSVVLAVTAWAIVARSQAEVVERTVTLPVVYRNVPHHWLVEEPVPGEVRATLSGPAADVRALEPARLPVTLDMSEVEEGEQIVTVDPATVRVPAGVVLQRVHPRTVDVVARRLVETRLRVTAHTKGHLPRGMVLEALRVEPERVTVLVPAKGRPLTHSLETVPLDLSELRTTTTVERRVPLPADVDSLDGSPLTVKVTAVLKERSANRRPSPVGSIAPP